MRLLTSVFLFVFCFTTVKSQTWYHVNPGDVPLVEIDGYDGGIAANISPINEPHLFSVNTSDSSNAWVYGTTSKSFFDNEIGWVTDSVNSYADSLRSELVVMIPSNDNYSYQTSWIAFEHKYSTDTLVDGGYLEYSCDSVNWQSIAWTWSQLNLPLETEIFNFPSIIHDTVYGFSGNQSEWTWSAVQFIWYVSVFQGNESRSNGCDWENMDTVYVRFVFESDSMETGKDGWMIRNMIIGLDNFPGAVGEYVKSPIDVYPNPASDMVRFLIPDGIETPTSTLVYDMAGRVVLSVPFHLNLDVSMLDAGNYIIALVTDKAVFRQKLLVK
ncbi:MAG: T9SS type A sorting domain-containing protein [Flavobacteriales bacterium]|nr:T9SS type A sorting domain-containing protein [Flavobacteriales bacterium]